MYIMSKLINFITDYFCLAQWF